MWQNSLFIGLCILLAGVSCRDASSNRSEEESSPRIVRNSKLVSPERNANFKIGDIITFHLEASDTPIDSVSLEYDGKEILYKNTEFTWNSFSAKTGTQKIRVKAFFGELTETHYPRITFYSNVEPQRLTYEVVKSYPHDPKAFTQGLFFKDDTLIESTGQKGTSWLSKMNLETGDVYKRFNLENQYFGEGSCYWNNQYIQLTYTSQVGFVYDNNFNRLKSFNILHEGWGITNWGDTLYVTDGSHVIHKLDPRDFTEIGKLEVYDQEDKISELNELEIINGLLYANVWQEDLIAVIDPVSGKLLKVIDLSGLLTRAQASRADVLNGIAYHPGWDKLFVTGKLWPTLFEIKLKPKN